MEHKISVCVLWFNILLVMLVQVWEMLDQQECMARHGPRHLLKLTYTLAQMPGRESHRPRQSRRRGEVFSGVPCLGRTRDSCALLTLHNCLYDHGLVGHAYYGGQPERRRGGRRVGSSYDSYALQAWDEESGNSHDVLRCLWLRISTWG